MTTGSIFGVVLLAISGGAFVLVGLLMERFSEKTQYENLSDFRRCKSRKVCGEWWVIAGIVVEIGVGIFSAVDAWLANPSNQPITYLSALVTLNARGTNFSDFDPSKNENRFFSQLEFGKYDLARSNSWDVALICKSCEVFGNSNERTWYLEYGIDPMPGLFNLKMSDKAAMADKWDAVWLAAPYLHKSDQILGGKIILMIDQKIKRFPIQQQIADPMFSQPPLAPTNGVRVTVSSWP
jgi:hypothetical protein